MERRARFGKRAPRNQGIQKSLPGGRRQVQFFTRMSIPLSTYLSMSLYLLANQWVTATDVGAGRLARTRATGEGTKKQGVGKGSEKDNAEAQSALRFAEKTTGISPQSARRAQSPRGDTKD